MGDRNVRNRGNRRTSPEREEEEMSESLHSALVENLFDEEEALLNLHMNVIQGMFGCCVCVCVCVCVYLFDIFVLCCLLKKNFSILAFFSF